MAASRASKDTTIQPRAQYPTKLDVALDYYNGMDFWIVATAADFAVAKLPYLVKYREQDPVITTTMCLFGDQAKQKVQKEHPKVWQEVHGRATEPSDST